MLRDRIGKLPHQLLAVRVPVPNEDGARLLMRSGVIHGLCLKLPEMSTEGRLGW